MMPANATEEYLRALHLGQKEKKKLESAGKDPFLPVLDEIVDRISLCTVVELPVQEIPADRILGTKTKGRAGIFSASFYPLADPETEFASKWIALCQAHLSDTGIRDPIECYEYLGNFYVQEGNKRVSVLKHFGAVSIPAKVSRILPRDLSDPRVPAYSEFVAFHRATGLYDIQFRKTGEYAKLYQAVGKKAGEKWTDDEIRSLSSGYHAFKRSFLELGSGKDSDLLPEDALLLFLKVYPYEQFCRMTADDLKNALSTLWGDVRAASDPDQISVKTNPGEEENKSIIGKLITVLPRHLNVAFVYQLDPETSTWTRGHAEGAAHLAAVMGDHVTVRNYDHADGPDAASERIAQAVSDGADLVFTTTPLLLDPTLKAAVAAGGANAKVLFFNCSACQPLSSVRSYYCRTYEGKFITGLIAGALADNNLVGYIGSYPILGVLSSINAFAAGVRMANPRASIYLEWSCLPGDSVQTLREKGVRIISNRDIPLADLTYMQDGSFGTFLIDEQEKTVPVASPVWMWGNLYENIVRSVLNGTLDKKAPTEAVNYWWGMDSGVIDVKLSDLVPGGVRRLAETFISSIKSGSFDPFSQPMTGQDGQPLCDPAHPLSSLELLTMNRLSDAVIGRIPAYEELLPMSRALVREFGARIIPVPAETEEAVQ